MLVCVVQVAAHNIMSNGSWRRETRSQSWIPPTQLHSLIGPFIRRLRWVEWRTHTQARDRPPLRLRCMKPLDQRRDWRHAEVARREGLDWRSIWHCGKVTRPGEYSKKYAWFLFCMCGRINHITVHSCLGSIWRE